MKPPRTALKLPRYCRRKPLKSGRWAYFFEPPTWARLQGCQIEAEALGQDYTAAMERAENVLLPAFDSWRSRGLTDMVPASPVAGSFDWLVSIFKAHQKWKEIDRKTQRQYEQGLALFANHRLKDNTRAGSKQISDFTRGFVDAIYAKLRVVEEKDKDGNIVGPEHLQKQRQLPQAWVHGRDATARNCTFNTDKLGRNVNNSEARHPRARRQAASVHPA